MFKRFICSQELTPIVQDIDTHEYVPLNDNGIHGWYIMVQLYHTYAVYMHGVTMYICVYDTHNDLLSVI